MTRPAFEYWMDMYRSARSSPLGWGRAVASASRLFRQERERFLWRLAERLGGRARVTRRPAMALWYDAFGRVGNAQVVPYSRPESYEPDRPLILRAAVNHYYGIRLTRPLVTRLGCPRGHVPDLANCRPRFELTAVPEEFADFGPWVGSVVEHCETGKPIDEPPHELRGWDPARVETSDDLWTERAWREVEAFHETAESRRKPDMDELEMLAR